jgi:hypothetical protein
MRKRGLWGFLALRTLRALRLGVEPIQFSNEADRGAGGR